MKIYNITKQLTAICEYHKTRNGFKHTATLSRNGYEYESVKCCYLNRTWERYQYETVLKNLFDKVKNNLTKYETRRFKTAIKNGDDPNPFRAVAMVTQIGDLLCDDKKEKNDWKTRMLKAGLEGHGLIMPDDWDELDEATKEERLNGAIDAIA